MFILTRYLLKEYLRIFIFCVISIISVLITTRLHEIAQFAALGASSKLVIKFTLLQIPYILPIAIPISCLVASIVILQRLSQAQELTVLRASGLSLKAILAPILIAALFIGLINFYIISEVATQSHLATKNLERQFRSINPLLLLQNKKLANIHGIFAQSIGHSRNGEIVHDLVLAFWNKQNEHIQIMTANKMNMNENQLIAENTTLIGSKFSSDNNQDDLFIENIYETETPTNYFSQLLSKSSFKIQPDHLTFAQLQLYLKENYELLKSTEADVSLYQKYIQKSHSEIARRISISLAALTFTLMGAACSIRIGRHRSYRPIIMTIAFATVYIVCFFVAKNLDHQFKLAASLYLLPQLVIILLSIRSLRRITRGLEA